MSECGNLNILNGMSANGADVIVITDVYTVGVLGYVLVVVVINACDILKLPLYRILVSIYTAVSTSVCPLFLSLGAEEIRFGLILSTGSDDNNSSIGSDLVSECGSIDTVFCTVKLAVFVSTYVPFLTGYGAACIFVLVVIVLTVNELVVELLKYLIYGISARAGVLKTSVSLTACGLVVSAGSYNVVVGICLNKLFVSYSLNNRYVLESADGAGYVAESDLGRGSSLANYGIAELVVIAELGGLEAGSLSNNTVSSVKSNAVEIESESVRLSVLLVTLTVTVGINTGVTPLKESEEQIGSSGYRSATAG
jgi:hypothetical protein